MSPRLAVFDCDGTLVDGQGAVCAAMGVAFAEAGLPPPDRHQVRRAVGLSLPMVIASLLPDAPVEQCRVVEQAYRSAYASAREADRQVELLYDGIIPLLDTLRAEGWLLGVATGKSMRGLLHVLTSHGLGGHFITLQTADHHPSKPHPAMLEAALSEARAAPDQAVMIGDTAYDMAMARAAGVRALGVDWGYHAPHELRAAGAQAVASTTEELMELMA